MIKKVYIFGIIFLFYFSFIPLKADSEVFEYKHEKGARYRILSIVDEAVLIEGFLSHRAEILNRIAVEVTDVVDGKGHHKAVFQTSERLIFDSQAKEQTYLTGFQWSREYDSVFVRDKL